MTRVTIIKEVADRKTGDTVDLSPGAAAFLVNAGYAEVAEAKAEQPKRTRRNAARSEESDDATDREHD